ncbi:MAG TPA: Wzz/FepE/Etk N-terminal domain-containing protein [Baekduia sp.]|nr:Wzz/FepE/Etk N-terminal domain-containing protein [Baekduia sp.]
MSGSPPADGGDLRILLAMLGRRAWVIVLAVVVGVAAALVLSSTQTKRYESTAKLLFRPTLLDYAVSGVTLQSPNRDQQREADTNLGLLSLEQVRQRAAARLGPEYTPKRIEKDVDIKSSGQSDLVSIKASASTPGQAARVADAVAGAFVTFQRAALRNQVVAAAQKVQDNLKQRDLPTETRESLRTTLERLKLLASVQTGGVEIVQRAEPPTSAASPKPLLNGILGGALGLVLGLGLALASEQLDRRVRRVDQLERALGLPVLAKVPRSRILGRRSDFTSRDAADAEEPFRRLRASLAQANGDAEPRSVLVTSAKTGSGKTTVATHLAAALAAGGLARVLLIEADLRRPRLAAVLELRRDRGLSNLLREADPFGPAASEQFFRIPLGGGSNGSAPGGPHALGFDALPAGPVPDNPSELLASNAMRELLLRARSRYDLIVVEAPPPTLVSDAIPLMKQADGVLVVGRLGYESEPELRALRNELARFQTTPVGAVANFSRRTTPY